MKIPIYQPAIGDLEKKYVNECLDTNWISSKGRFVSNFEEAFREKIGASYSTAVCNGTVALHLALVALGVGEGDEVIVPTFTYIASVNAIHYTGAKPVFVDSVEDSWQMDVDDVAAKITPKTRVVMAVHLYGHPCDLNSLKQICEDKGIFLIEDCAEAIGSYVENKHVGTYGHASTFSFFGNKTITTGEGGMVVTNNQTIHERIEHYKGQGLAKYREYWHDVIGYNYRMTNVCAAIGLAQLENWSHFLKNKRKLAKRYEQDLVGLPLKTHPELNGYTHSYWMCSILLDDSNKRDSLRDYLSEKGVETRPLFYPVHTMPMYSEHFQSFPVAENIARSGINLPSWPMLSEEKLVYITNQIKNYFK